MSDNMPERVTLRELPGVGKFSAKSDRYRILAEWMTGEPGTWFKITESTRSTAAGNFRSGTLKAFPKGEFQFAVRKDDETGLFIVWGRKPVEG